MSRARSSLLAAGVLAAVALPVAADAKRGDGGERPERIALPDGFRPEGIARAGGARVVVGSIPTGALFLADTRTGAGRVLEPGAEGRAAIGLKVRGGRVYVAGGPTGKVRVHDLRTGDVLREEQAAGPGDTFVNDVVVAGDTAYFTDSRRAVLYALPATGDGPVRTIPLTGDFVLTPGVNNLNGIAAADGGEVLLAVQSNTGQLKAIDPDTGVVRTVDLGGEALTNGDGLLLEGRTLHVVQNRLNTIGVFRLSDDLATGVKLGALTDPDFRVPTTITRVRGDLYAPNARFGAPTTPDVDFDVVRVDGS